MGVYWLSRARLIVDGPFDYLRFGTIQAVR